MSTPVFSQAKEPKMELENARRTGSNSLPADARSEAIAWQNIPGEADYSRALVLFTKGHYAKAAALNEKACDRSNFKACTDLGVMYKRGQGVRRNYVRAAEFSRRGCDGGNALGCTNLGIMYWNNILPKNDSRVAELFKQGCEGGDPGGCLGLGFLYENGQGVQKSEKQAAQLYQQACEEGNGPSCTQLSTLKKILEAVSATGR